MKSKELAQIIITEDYLPSKKKYYRAKLKTDFLEITVNSENMRKLWAMIKDKVKL